MPDHAPSPIRRSHRLGDEEPRVLLGLGWSELVAFAVLLGAGLMILSARKDALGVAISLGLAVFGALLGWGRHRGQSLAQWTGVAVRHQIERALGHGEWSRSVTEGHAVNRGQLRQQIDLPGELGRLHVLETSLHEDGTGPLIGALFDRRADTYTATLLVRSTSNYGLLGHEDQDRVLANWAGALEELARDQSPIRRIAWVERTLPEHTDALADYLHQHRDPHMSLDASPVRSYLELLDQAGATTDRHELLVSIQITGRAARRAARGRGWTRKQTALRVLAGELDLAAQALQQAGLDVRRPLDADALVTAVRIGLDPWARERPHADTSADTSGKSGGSLGDAELAGMARRAAWDHVLWDGSQHTTLWISRWPRQPVRSMFLAPLLMRAEATRAVGVVMELLGPERGLRQAETTVADDESNEALRWRGGLRTKRRVAKREASNRQREDELAEGHIDIRWAGFVSVAVPGTDPHVRHQAVDRVKAQATRCGLRLEVMSGQQAEALTFLLPLGRGLR